ncbi:PREDICTED: probable G-protein coupled receptor 123 [Dipodomys ordii]|uniref:Probable G-protein coupled receptor 123 n=1 Tax=Dipodomys ordii TaxID=10020 RepID=A0A1S3GSM5_DIPOR|nr:PREDICTED: probable G-protein coupled receptor 123 [Dipodomys ordii]
MLWIGVTARNIYKQVTRKAPPCPGADQPPYPKQPLLRYWSVLPGPGATQGGPLGTPDRDEPPQGLARPFVFKCTECDSYRPEGISEKKTRFYKYAGAFSHDQNGAAPGSFPLLTPRHLCWNRPGGFLPLLHMSPEGMAGSLRAPSGQIDLLPQQVYASTLSDSCWMAWEPSLGAFYGPAAFITLVTCVYFLGTYIQLRRHPERRYELQEHPEERRRLAGPEGSRCPGPRPCTPPGCDGPAASPLQNEHSFQAQLRAAACTLFLFSATWTFGALAVSQGPFLDMVFSCLYGAFCVTLGLFVLIHHCAKREDVWQCWWSCCPSRGDAATSTPGAHPALDANGDALGHAARLPDSPCASQPRGFGHLPSGHCKMTNLQAAQGHVGCLPPATPCCAKMHCEQLMEEEAHMRMAEGDAFPHTPRPHRCLEGRTKPHYFSRHQAAAHQSYAYHIPSSLDGSAPSSHTDSPLSSLEGPEGVHTLACCAQAGPFPLVSQPEGGEASLGLYGCPPRLPPGPAHLEMLRRTPSLSFHGPSPDGLLRGSIQEGLPFSTDSTGNIRTGPWKNETTV